MKKKDIDSVREMVGLTDAECRKIERFRAGQGLFIAGENRMTLQFNPSETEKLLTFTDNETLQRYAMIQSERAREEERRLAMENAENMQDVFGEITLDLEPLVESPELFSSFVQEVLIGNEELFLEIRGGSA